MDYKVGNIILRNEKVKPILNLINDIELDLKRLDPIEEYSIFRDVITRVRNNYLIQSIKSTKEFKIIAEVCNEFITAGVFEDNPKLKDKIFKLKAQANGLIMNNDLRKLLDTDTSRTMIKDGSIYFTTEDSIYFAGLIDRLLSHINKLMRLYNPDYYNLINMLNEDDTNELIGTYLLISDLRKHKIKPVTKLADFKRLDKALLKLKQRAFYHTYRLEQYPLNEDVIKAIEAEYYNIYLLTHDIDIFILNTTGLNNSESWREIEKDRINRKVKPKIVSTIF